MTCQRCGGFAIGASFSGGVDALEGWEYDGWKCVNCGHITDPLIDENRRVQANIQAGRLPSFATVRTDSMAAAA